MFCHNCGFKSRVQFANFCPKCGVPMPDVVLPDRAARQEEPRPTPPGAVRRVAFRSADNSRVAIGGIITVVLVVIFLVYNSITSTAIRTNGTDLEKLNLSGGAHWVQQPVSAASAEAQYMGGPCMIVVFANSSQQLHARMGLTMMAMRNRAQMWIGNNIIGLIKDPKAACVVDVKVVFGQDFKAAPSQSPGTPNGPIVGPSSSPTDGTTVNS